MRVSLRSTFYLAVLCSPAIAPLTGCGGEAAKSPAKAEHFERDGHDHSREGHDHKEGEADHK